MGHGKPQSKSVLYEFVPDRPAQVSLLKVSRKHLPSPKTGSGSECPGLPTLSIGLHQVQILRLWALGVAA